MKKLCFLILLTLIVVWANAQKHKVNYLTTFDDRLLHFGFTLGISSLDFNVVNYGNISDITQGITLSPEEQTAISGKKYIHADVAEMLPGLTVGIVTSLRISRDLNLRFLPGLSFGERRIRYNIPVYDRNTASSASTIQFYSSKSTFLDFPLLLKYSARRINNNRPYVICGGALRQDISRSAKDDLIKLKKSGFYFEIGGGWDHYFPFFRLSTELKFSYGLTNQLGELPSQNNKIYAKSIKELRSKIITLSFHFE